MFTNVTVETGQIVNVEMQRIHNGSGVPSFKVVARFGSTTVELSHTTGPTDGEHTMPVGGQVQAALDTLRQRAANMAVVREELRRQLAEVQ